MGDRRNRLKRKKDKTGHRNSPAESPKRLKGSLDNNHNKQSPHFCMYYMDASFCVKNCDTEDRAKFANKIRSLSTQTWQQILNGDRYALGVEKMPVGKCACAMPQEFNEQSHFLVLRYAGKKPMGGVRRGRVFHIIWVEHNFGDVYSHEKSGRNRR